MFDSPALQLPSGYSAAFTRALGVTCAFAPLSMIFLTGRPGVWVITRRVRGKPHRGTGPSLLVSYRSVVHALATQTVR
jgi:hypothetical protein